MTSTFERTRSAARAGVPIILALGPSELESDVLPFHIAQLAQALAEGLETALSYRVRRGARI